VPDVFISYKREERPRVERLAAALISLKLDVWFDADVLPGVPFLAEIQHALNASRAVIVCWTPAATLSAHVLGEAEHGRAQRKLVAAFFAQCPLPSPFNMIHAEDLSDWGGDVGDMRSPWRKILGGVGALTNRPGLLEFIDYSRARDALALRRWANENWKDPLAVEAVERARRIEAGDFPAAPAGQPDSARDAGASTGARAASAALDPAIERLGAKAQQAASVDDNGEALVILGTNHLEGYAAPRTMRPHARCSRRRRGKARPTPSSISA
jgi:hypothetical protein